VKSIKLGEVARIYNGNSINEKVKAKNFTGLPMGTPYIATKDISYTRQVDYENGVKIPTANEGEFKLAKKGAVLLCAEGGSAGRKMAIIERDVFFGNKLFCFECDTGLNSKFLFYYLQAPTFQDLFKSSITGLIGGVSLEKVRNLPIVLPSLQKQTEIVEKLDSAFEEIYSLEAKVRNEIDTIEQLFQGLIDWKFEDISDSAKQFRLEEFCTKIQDGSHFSPKEQISEPKDGWFPYLTSKNVRNNYVDLKDITYINAEFHQGIYQRCNPEYGDLLLTKDGVNTGNVTINTLTFPFSLLSSVCILKVKKDLLDATYLKFYLQSSKGNRNILGDMTGAAIKRIILKTIKNLSIPIVEIERQRELGESLESNLLSINAYKVGLKNKISLIESLRQSFLANLLSQEEVVV
jgi:type I restriction enzyme S subunit